jgi:hypothetical protein
MVGTFATLRRDARRTVCGGEIGSSDCLIHWWLSLSLVTYIALIGIFAIEELNGRDETLRVLLAGEARLGVESLRNEESDLKELNGLRGLRQSVVALVVSGAVDQAGGALTLREIQCQLVKL